MREDVESQPLLSSQRSQPQYKDEDSDPMVHAAG